MDDLADMIANIHTAPKPDDDWNHITRQIREMPSYRLPQLWRSLLRNLAREPPEMPPGDITPDQWMTMCQAQYYELYRCACRDAGMEVTSVGNSGGRVEGSAGVNTSSIDLSAITSQLAQIRDSQFKRDIAEMATNSVKSVVDQYISSADERHAELSRMLAEMKTQQTSEQDTVRQIIADISANKQAGDRKIEEVSEKIEKKINPILVFLKYI